MKYGRANKNEDFRKIKFILLEITRTFFTLYMLIVNLELDIGMILSSAICNILDNYKWKGYRYL